MPDSSVPLCSYSQFTEGAFGDLVSDYEQPVVQNILVEATRMCEDVAGTRLAPFTVTETHRAEGIDPDEYADSANMPMDIRSTLSANYAEALGAQNMVRHCWLDQRATRYPDMWEYSNVEVTIIRSYGGTQILSPSQILNGPEPDTGHVWFQLGQFIPVGSRIQVSYTAGYNPVPASLVRACKYMAASIVIRELDPVGNTRDPDQLHTDALLILDYWERAT